VFWTFIEAGQMADGQVTIGGPQGHHLARVLRVHPGERGVAVANGREYQLEVIKAGGSRVVARLLSERPVQGEASTAVTLLQAVLPNPDFDAVIENGTAVGIRRFIAVQAERSVGRPPASRLARWQLIAGSAAEQSHRGEVPDVSGPTPLSDALTQVAGTRLLVLEPTAPTPLSEALDGSAGYAMAVGPEGGWTERELTTLRERGGVPVNLGPRILRARLAPVVAAAILVQQP
jgi:16S rRNA (uracil1498-N3)-methyltransferase